MGRKHRNCGDCKYLYIIGITTAGTVIIDCDKGINKNYCERGTCEHFRCKFERPSIDMWHVEGWLDIEYENTAILPDKEDLRSCSEFIDSPHNLNNLLEPFRDKKIRIMVEPLEDS